MITLYQFKPAFGLPNASPFCMKLETYLRMTGLPYEVAKNPNIFKAPKGKFPYITDRDQVVADSTLIIEYLKSRYGDPLDADLSRDERAVALAWRHLMEEHLYWVLLYARWVEQEGWALTRPAFFGDLPRATQWFLPGLVRRTMKRQLMAQGTGRHRREDIYALGDADITALGNFLADKPYFLGDRPTSIDATAYAFLANLVSDPTRSPVAAHARNFDNIVEYCERMQRTYFPDWPPASPSH